jgi:nucleotide-binding universal stress UspA family protein
MTTVPRRTVLVPIDGSDVSLRALRRALADAVARPGTRLHVLTVHPKPLLYGGAQIHVTRDSAERMAAEHDTAVLDRARTLAAEVAEVPCDFEALEGEPAADVIARRAGELGSDSIIMGTHGRGRAGVALLGSVATGVVHRAEVPVTLVK